MLSFSLALKFAALPQDGSRSTASSNETLSWGPNFRQKFHTNSCWYVNLVYKSIKATKQTTWRVPKAFYGHDGHPQGDLCLSPPSCVQPPRRVWHQVTIQWTLLEWTKNDIESFMKWVLFGTHLNNHKFIILSNKLLYSIHIESSPSKDVHLSVNPQPDLCSRDFPRGKI